MINVSNIVGGCAPYIGAPPRQLDVRNIYNNPVFYETFVMVNAIWLR
jgi:hypothetical protein